MHTQLIFSQGLRKEKRLALLLNRRHSTLGCDHFYFHWVTLNNISQHLTLSHGAPVVDVVAVSTDGFCYFQAVLSFCNFKVTNTVLHCTVLYYCSQFWSKLTDEHLRNGSGRFSAKSDYEWHLCQWWKCDVLPSFFLWLLLKGRRRDGSFVFMQSFSQLQWFTMCSPVAQRALWI